MILCNNVNILANVPYLHIHGYLNENIRTLISFVSNMGVVCASPYEKMTGDFFASFIRENLRVMTSHYAVKQEIRTIIFFKLKLIPIPKICNGPEVGGLGCPWDPKIMSIQSYLVTGSTGSAEIFTQIV